MAKFRVEQIKRLDVEKINSLNTNISNSAKEIMKIVSIETKQIYNPLDILVADIREAIADSTQLSNETLEYYIINLSSLIYTLTDNLENSGMYADISKAIKTEKFNNIHLYTAGTVADKENAASEGTIKEQVVTMIWDRVYKIGKLKIENAREVLASLKKIVNIRGLGDGQ